MRQLPPALSPPRPSDAEGGRGRRPRAVRAPQATGRCPGAGAVPAPRGGGRAPANSLIREPTQAVEHELSGCTIRLESRRVVFPLIRSKRPGSVMVTPDRVAALLEQEDLGVSP